MTMPLPFDAANFEELGKVNGFRYWLARDFMGMLGYSDFTKFQKAIDRARAACIALEIDIDDNFVRVNDTGGEIDFKLSRFACYLTAMNGDPKQAEVAAAQVYFATIAEGLRRCMTDQEPVERIVTRKEIADREKNLAEVAWRAEVQNYAFFQNAGYVGMYNRSINDLRELRGIDKDRSPLDFMGKAELAANLFRITQTEEKIKNESIRGQKALEKAAKDAGKKVRDAMIEIGGVAPESLPTHPDIRTIKSGLKSGSKALKKIDKKKN